MDPTVRRVQDSESDDQPPRRSMSSSRDPLLVRSNEMRDVLERLFPQRIAVSKPNDARKARAWEQQLLKDEQQTRLFRNIELLLWLADKNNLSCDRDTFANLGGVLLHQNLDRPAAEKVLTLALVSSRKFCLKISYFL